MRWCKLLTSVRGLQSVGLLYLVFWNANKYIYGPIYALRQPAFAYNLLKAFLRRINGPYSFHFIMSTSFAETFILPFLSQVLSIHLRRLYHCLIVMDTTGLCSKSDSLYRLNCVPWKGLLFSDFAWILVVVISSPLQLSTSANKTFSSFCQSSTMMNSASVLRRVL